jgi:hypothetical protein
VGGGLFLQLHRRPLESHLAPLYGRLTVSPTPAKQICAQAAHYGTDHSSDNETPGVHRTSPPNYTFANETYLRHLNPYPYPRRPGDDNLARLRVTKRPG